MKDTSNTNNIKSGDIACVRRHISLNPLSWLSAAVRFFTGTRWNHSFLFIRIENKLYVIEAIEQGLTLCSYANWVKKYKHDIKVIRFDHISKPPDINNIMLSYVGRPYDYTSLIKHQLLYQLRRWFTRGKWKGRKRESAKAKLYCSEYVALVYGIANWWTYSTAEILEHDHDIVYIDYHDFK